MRGCSVGPTLDMPDMSPFRAAVALNIHKELPELTTALSSGRGFGAAGFRD